jgi:hypothetical protein
MTSKLSLQDISSAVPKIQYANGATELLQDIRAKGQSLHVPTFVALYLIHDLYDGSSSDEANLNRIITNLDAVTLELSSMLHAIGRLRREID